MGALGLLIADWLADLGARRIILAGRTALPPRCNWDDDDNDAETRHRIAAVRALELRGVALDIVAVDIGSPDAVRELLARRDRDGAPPVRGVVHAAGVTENRLLTETDHETLSRVMWPKVAGVMALRDSFPVDQLDFFFLTSSAATVFGVPGQGAYAAANAFLDCFARVRRGEGGHAMSLDWVAWQGLGFGAEAPVVQDELARRGSRPITAQEAFTAWEYVARYDLARAVIAPMPSSDAGSAGTAGVECDAQRALAWAQLDADDLFAELQGGLRAILAAELHTPEGAVDVDTPFAEMGLNSVTAMSIRRQVERLVGVELSATMLWNHPTIDSLASYLANRLLPQQDTGSGGEGGGPADDDVPGGLLDSLFDDVESTTANSEGRS